MCDSTNIFRKHKSRTEANATTHGQMDAIIGALLLGDLLVAPKFYADKAPFSISVDFFPVVTAWFIPVKQHIIKQLETECGFS